MLFGAEVDPLAGVASVLAAMTALLAAYATLLSLQTKRRTASRDELQVILTTYREMVEDQNHKIEYQDGKIEDLIEQRNHLTGEVRHIQHDHELCQSELASQAAQIKYLREKINGTTSD